LNKSPTLYDASECDKHISNWLMGAPKRHNQNHGKVASTIDDLEAEDNEV